MRRTELEALALGLLHGPAELVPVSSSGHVAALPWLLRWEVAGWDGARRKELEVALHAGTAAALLVVLRPARVRPRVLVRGAAAAGAGRAVVLERRIEERLGTPATLAAGLLAGGAALVLADRAHGARGAGDCDRRRRPRARAGPGGRAGPGRLAQRRDAGRGPRARLRPRRRVAALLGGRAARAAGRDRAEGRPPGREDTVPGTVHVRPLALGAGAAFASTLATARAIGIERRAPLWPWAAWRAGLAAAILAVRHNRSR